MKKMTFSSSLTLLLLLPLFSCQNEDFFEKAVQAQPAPGTVDEIPLDPPPVSTPVTPPVMTPPPRMVEIDLCLQNPQAPACQQVPQVSRAGVVTILLALGDTTQNGVVINEDSSRLIISNVINFTSPVINPKILLVLDHNHNGESLEDTPFLARIISGLGHSVERMNEPSTGLRLQDIEGYDIVWLNNPGHPMGSRATYELLKQFSGGVIISGDDMSRGRKFSPQLLTGLEYLDNGASVSCNCRSYSYDNNRGHRYQVGLVPQFLAGVDSSLFNFEYGNDIDNTRLLYPNPTLYQVLAYASGEQGTCQFSRPVIIRYEKNNMTL
jgi:hypothetical protein